MSPPHNVTNPSGRTLLHTPPFPSFHILRQLSEDRGPGTTTGKDGDPRGLRQSRRLAPSLHTYIPLCSPLSPFLCAFCFSGSRALCAHFVTTGVFFLPGSRPDIRHMSPRRPRPHCPEARCSPRLEVQHCDTFPTSLSLSYSLSVMVEGEALRSFTRVEAPNNYLKKKV